MQTATDGATVVRTAVERFSAGDDEAFAALFAPEATIETVAELADKPVLHGRDAVLEWCREIRAQWPAVRMGLGELAGHGGQTVGELYIIGEGGWRVAIVVDVDDGLVQRVRTFWDMESARRQVGPA
jgi:ketosteroid isomerase-like protein